MDQTGAAYQGAHGTGLELRGLHQQRAFRASGQAGLRGKGFGWIQRALRAIEQLYLRGLVPRLEDLQQAQALRAQCL